MSASTATAVTRRQGRIPVPAEVQRKLLLECGFQCSVPQCRTTQALEFHHVNGNRRDNREDNLLVLCAVHHALAHEPRSRLDRKACIWLKQGITKLSRVLEVDKKELIRIWKKLRTEGPGGDERGRLIESLTAGLLATIPGFIVAKRGIPSPIGDRVDILIRNETADPFLSKLGPYVPVECKARLDRPVEAPEVAAFLGKMALNRFTTGIMFSLSGFTQEAVSMAGSATRKDLMIILVGPDDVSDMIESRNRAENIKEAATRSLLAG